MHRSSAIAAIVAASGILVAASVASLAVVNAASSNAVAANDMTLIASLPPVADGTVTDYDVPEPSMTPSPTATLNPNTVGGVALPALPNELTPGRTTGDEDGSATGTPRSKPATAKPAAKPRTTKPSTAKPSTAKPAAKPSTAKPSAAKPSTAKPAAKPSAAKPSSKPAAKPSTAKPSAKPSARPEISADEGRNIVMAATGGGILQSVTHTEHNGSTAWAVQVRRHDTSVVTGWVDSHTGTIIDWHVDKEADPTPTPTPTTGSGSTSGSSGSGHGHDNDD